MGIRWYNMKKDKETIETELLEALHAYHDAREICQEASDDFYDAEEERRDLQIEYDHTFYDYVKFGTPEYLSKHKVAGTKLDNAIAKSSEARIRYKSAQRTFKKAERVYARLQKKAEKMGIIVPQFGE